MIYVFLADGFEEIEALAPVDFLRRLSLDVKTVAVKGSTATGAHGIKVFADITPAEIEPDLIEAVVLPGGMPGSTNLFESADVKKAVMLAAEKGALVCAICAAPFVLGRWGLLKGKNATCFPGFEDELTGAAVLDKGVVKDGNIITARGAGVAWQFGAAIGACFKGEAAADEVLRGMQWNK